jgi:hypothetical protein
VSWEKKESEKEMHVNSMERWELLRKFTDIIRRFSGTLNIPFIYFVLAKTQPDMLISRSRFMTCMRVDLKLPIAGLCKDEIK